MHAPDPASSGTLPLAAADMLARLRARRPRVHCITNNVAQHFTANVLLAIGASPSMTIAPQEIGDFAARADSLLVNLGTFDEERRSAVDIALDQARKNGRRWVLDPVLIDVSAPRAAYARLLVTRAPAAIRLNEVEFTALAMTKDPAAFAQKEKIVVGITGESDLVTDGARRIDIRNGHALMGRITAMGCAASALVAAALAVEDDPFIATAAALLVFGVAGEVAAESANGPGAFAVALIDSLFNLQRDALQERAKVS
jgi:hydroxyethylthiazole kinase